MKTYFRLAIRMMLAAAVFGTVMAIAVLFEMVRLHQYSVSIVVCLVVIFVITFYTWIGYIRLRKRNKNQ